MSALGRFLLPGEALTDQARRRPDAEALVFPLSGGRLSFAQWDADATALARACLDAGLRPGDHVALLAENRLEWPVVQLAIARLGAVMVPLNTHYRSDDLKFALGDGDCRALFLSPRYRSNPYLETVNGMRADLPLLDHVVAFDGSPDGALSYAALLDRGRASSAALPRVDPDSVASLQFTSGTTGFPKGTLLTHRGMMRNSAETARRLHLQPGDRWTSIIPLFHCAGCIMNLLGSLQAGACYVGVPSFDPEQMFRIIAAERCTALSGVPTSYVGMLRHPARPNYDLGSLRTGTCGGADVDPAVLEACAREFPMPGLVQVYGQTESSTLIACPDSEGDARLATAGFPLDGYAVRITDPHHGTPLAAGQIGQIEARGDMVMIGYYKQPEATAEAIDADGWLKTGDLGFLTAEGRLVIAGGRLRDMIIRGGENIYPAEVENVLRQHSAVMEAAVFGLKDDYYGEIVGAAVKLRDQVGADALRAHCAERIARFKAPARIFMVEDFPSTSSGKIQKRFLRTEAEGGRLRELP